MNAIPPPALVAVVGAGTMGAGIAVAFARAGVDVRLVARRESSLARARARIEEGLGLFVEAGELAPAAAGEAAGRIVTTTVLEEAVATAELVVESIPEDLESKARLLERAEEAAPAGVVLATNTSSLPIAHLAASLRRPEAFAGFHWFVPAELVELVEVVSGPGTAPETAARLLGWATAIGKRPIHVLREADGFVANRLQYALIREAFALVEAGICSYEDIDEAVKEGLGPRWAALGPFEFLDLAGLDVHYEVARRLYPTLTAGTEPAAAVVQLLADSALGCKTGRGLRGSYDGEAVALLRRRVARVLLGLGRLRAEFEAGSSSPTGR